jgi:hypothetical protein
MSTKNHAVELAAAPVRALTAAKAVVADQPDRPVVMIALGANLAAANFFVLTLEDAARLRTMIGQALRDPNPVLA